jgi:hypothetical protein
MDGMENSISGKTLFSKSSFMKYPSLLVLGLLFCAQLPAQTDFSPSRSLLGISYFGETYTHPGAQLSFDRTWKYWTIEKVSKKGKNKDKAYFINWGIRTGFYNHPRNHLGIFLTPAISGIRMNRRGGFYQVGLQAGLMHRRLNVTVFDPNQEGARWLYLTGGMHVRIGKDLSLKHPKVPVQWFFGSNIFVTVPFATSLLLQTSIEVGLTFKLN